MPYCANCGTEVSPQAVACTSCGMATGVSPAAAASAGRRTEGLAIASLVAGIVGLFMCLFIGPIVAIILGYSAKRKIAEDPTLDGAGLAQAGIVIGWIGIAVDVLLLLLGALPFLFIGSFQ